MTGRHHESVTFNLKILLSQSMRTYELSYSVLVKHSCQISRSDLKQHSLKSLSFLKPYTKVEDRIILKKK